MQGNRALTALHLPGCPDALAEEIHRLLVVNTTLDYKLLAVMMSTHARLGAKSALEVLDASQVVGERSWRKMIYR